MKCSLLLVEELAVQNTACWTAIGVWDPSFAASTLYGTYLIAVLKVLSVMGWEDVCPADVINVYVYT
ncbi:MAG TPA: hypothetical protein VM802_05345 [Chitinophaga sp.]|uniref:hypothetical protein n=1 Tax=Chitinophaga sp. TaxID=1869181 RepID=UPI002CF97381|nr:hypothetical protein [Chitinophaga sp.]HVI44268.1 hypothetical protein [Chitinophaga sp.]